MSFNPVLFGKNSYDSYLTEEETEGKESLGNLLEISLWQVAETGFKCKSKTESRAHNPESAAILCSKSPSPSFPSNVED